MAGVLAGLLGWPVIMEVDEVRRSDDEFVVVRVRELERKRSQFQVLMWQHVVKRKRSPVSRGFGCS